MACSVITCTHRPLHRPFSFLPDNCHCCLNKNPGSSYLFLITDNNGERKMKRATTIIGMVTMLLIMTIPMHADGFVYAQHKMMIYGTSTLHDWKCPANKMKAKSDITMQNNELQSVNSMWVEADALSIKSDKEDMDEKIYEALKTDANQFITFTLSKVKSMTKKGNEYILETSGKLTIAGKSNEVDMTVKATVDANGNVTFKGEKKLLMTSFGMTPPKAMLGMIKAGDEIKLDFTLTMKRG
ncbi:MAG: YceI family protein [Candidatus Kapabacteria bacterium]|nr:YceI family protein [Candidatus Kapabacteria bacterium]